MFCFLLNKSRQDSIWWFNVISEAKETLAQALGDLFTQHQTYIFTSLS